MPKKKGGGRAGQKKSLSERQNVPPGTKAAAQPARDAGAEALQTSMEALEQRAAQIATLGLEPKKGPGARQPPLQAVPEVATAAGGGDGGGAAGPPVPASGADPSGEIDGLVEFNAGAEKAMANEWDDALRLFTVATEKNAAVGAFWHYRGLAAQRAGKLQAGIDSLRKAVKIGGVAGSAALLHSMEQERLAHSAVGARHAGDQAMEANDYGAAVAAYTQAIELVGERAPTMRAACHHGRGVAQAMGDEWEGAARDWELAIVCDAAGEGTGEGEGGTEARAMYHHYLGLAQKQLGKVDEAVAALRTAVEMGYEKSREALAGVEAQQSSWQGRWEEGWRRFHSEEPALSITAFEAAIAAGAPDTTTAHLVIAFAHAKLEQWREGVEAMTAGLATAPTDADWSAQRPVPSLCCCL